MCMSLDRRVQLLLDQQRYDKVAALALKRGTSVGSVIREAIDRGVPSAEDRRQAAARQILAAEPVAVPDVPELLAELDDLRARHR